MNTTIIITRMILLTVIIISNNLNIKGVTDNSSHKIGLEYRQLKIYSDVKKNQQN